VAEWRGTGLQNLIRRFESAHDVKIAIKMSIYLEFPTIKDYPDFPDPKAIALSIQISEEDLLLQIRQEQQLLQDFLILRMV
jgi:hypothetical protein